MRGAKVAQRAPVQLRRSRPFATHSGLPYTNGSTVTPLRAASPTIASNADQS